MVHASFDFHSPPVFVLFPWSTLTTQACLHRNATNLLQEDSEQGGSEEGQTGAVQLGPDGRHALGQVRPCCVHAAFINLSALCQPFHSRVCLYLLLKLRTHCPSTTSMQRGSYCCTCFMCRALLGALQPALLPCMVCTAQPPKQPASPCRPQPQLAYTWPAPMLFRSPTAALGLPHKAYKWQVLGGSTIPTVVLPCHSLSTPHRQRRPTPFSFFRPLCSASAIAPSHCCRKRWQNPIKGANEAVVVHLLCLVHFLAKHGMDLQFPIPDHVWESGAGLRGCMFWCRVLACDCGDAGRKGKCWALVLVVGGWVCSQVTL